MMTKSERIARFIVLCAMVLGATGCAMVAQEAPVEFAPPEAEMAQDSWAGDESGEAPPAPGGRNYAAVEKLIVYTASMDIVVSDTAQTLDAVEDVVDELGGWIVELNTNQYLEGQQAYVRLRVPAESLDEALERFHALATEVREETKSGQDVTDEYVDLRSSLRNRQATQERLLSYLEEAENTEEALAVDAQLRPIEAEIEQLKGRIQYLEESAAMATVTLNITPDALAQPIEVGGWNIQGAFRQSIENLVDGLQFLIEDLFIPLTFTVAPILLVIASPFVVLFFIIRALVRRRCARQTAVAAEED